MDYEKNCSYDPDEDLSEFLKNASDDHILEFISGRKINISGIIPIYKYNGTYFHFLITYEKYEVINRLLEGEVKLKMEVDVNVKSPGENKVTALHLACRERNIEAVNFLLSKGADVNAKCSYENLPIHYLFFGTTGKNRRLEILKLLLRGGSQIDEKNKNGDTPLFLATDHYNTEVIDLLLEYGADFHTNCSNKITPFEKAFDDTYYNHIERYLRRVDTLPSYSDGRIYIVFYKACLKNLDVMVKLFLEKGLNVEGIGLIYIDRGNKFSPLNCALSGRGNKALKVLLDYNAKFTYEDDKVYYGEYQKSRYIDVRGYYDQIRVFQEYFQEKSMKIKPALRIIREEN